MVTSNLALSRQPFLYLTASFVAGILVDDWVRLAQWIAAGIAFASVILSVWFIASRRDAHASVSILLAFFAVGALLAKAEKADTRGATLKVLYEAGTVRPDVPVELIGTLARPPEPAPEACYLEIDAENIRLDADALPATGRVRLMMPLQDGQAKLDVERLNLDYGARLRMLVRLEEARSFNNPGSPDFNDFLERQGYQLKGTIKSPLLIERLGDTPVNPVLATLFHFRLRVISAIDARLRPPLAGTLKAMLVDNRYFLDSATVEKLRQAGTFHVISISGMHVGLIAVLLLGGMSRARPRSRLWVCLVMLVLWAYAVMVGLAPPVTRACP